METSADIVNEFYETCNSKQGQGMEAFAETLAIFFADWIQVVNGKIARQRLYYDPRQFVKAFGM